MIGGNAARAVIDIFAMPTSETHGCNTLVENDQVEIRRLVVPAGQLMHQQAAGFAVLQCLAGRVSLTAGDLASELGAGQLVLLPAGTSYSFEAEEDASLLEISFADGEPAAAQGQTRAGANLVQEASEESFPASDAPGWTEVHSGA